jgi:hypothetical protein
MTCTLLPCRNVLKPQKMLDYNVGGTSWTGKKVNAPGPGFKTCIVVR